MVSAACQSVWREDFFRFVPLRHQADGFCSGGAVVGLVLVGQFRHCFSGSVKYLANVAMLAVFPPVVDCAPVLEQRRRKDWGNRACYY